MIKSHCRGNEIEYYDGDWHYCDSGYHTSELSGSGQFRICIKCKKGPTKEGHDGCLGTIPGAYNACCGHGEINTAYIQFTDMFCIRGQAAINIFKLHED